MWSRAAVSDNGIGPNRDRHAVPELLGKAPLRPRETRLSGKETTRQLSVIACGFCNLRATAGKGLKDQEEVVDEL